MDVSKYLEEQLPQLPKSDRDEVNSILCIYAVKKEEPGFLLFRTDKYVQETWVLTFDDRPTFWIKIFGSEGDGRTFASRYELKLTKVDTEWNH